MLTMTLGTAPPTQTSDYKMVQLEHSTKLCHTRHTNTQDTQDTQTLFFGVR